MLLVAWIVSLHLASATVAMPLADVNPWFSESFQDRAEDLQRQRQREHRAREAAIQEWRRAVEQNPANIGSHRELARALKANGRYDEAISTLQRALALNPADGETHRELGNCYSRDRNFAEAAESLERATWYEPGNIRAWSEFVDSLESAGKFARAADVSAAVARQFPSSFTAHYLLGRSLCELNRFEEAIKPLNRAAELRPNDFLAHWWAANALMRAGRFREAVTHAKRAREIEPASEEAKRLLFFSSLAAGEITTASKIYPAIIGIAAGVLNGLYVVVLLALCWFSFRTSKSIFPPLSLSLGWVALSFEGQAAFMLSLAFIPLIAGTSTLLVAVLLPTLPILLVATLAFARQPWGQAFRWPLRFGGPRTFVMAMLFLLASFVVAGVTSKALSWISGREQSIQSSVLVLREGMSTHPVLGFLVISLMVPIAEEILFRGLIYGALCRWMRVSLTIAVSALLFALMHFDFAFFVPLFVLGLLLGWARARSGSLGLPIVIHFLNNAVAILASVFAVPQ